MQCSDVIPELSALRRGELSAELAQELRQHVSNCPICRQMGEEISSIEQCLETMPADWRAPDSGFAPVTLADLRQRAALLSQDQREGLIRETVALLPTDTAGHPAQDTGLSSRWWYRWRRQLFATAAACLIVVLFLPQVIMASVDLPGVGPLIQRVVLQYAGLSWAYENGYIQGTMAQVSQNGVTLRVIGIAADPIQTSVIYLIQGMDGPKPNPENAVPVRLGGHTDPISVMEDSYTISVVSIDDEKTWSSSDIPFWTQIGYVGVLQTAPLPVANGTIEIELRIRGSDSAPLSLELPTTREAVSKLAQELPIDHEQTADGITVTGKRVVFTPALVMVEYTIQGGDFIYGWSQPEIQITLEGSGKPTGKGYVGSYASGTWVDGVMHARAIFTRPSSLENLRLNIPWLAKDIPIDLTWPLEKSEGELTLLGIPVQVKSRREGEGKVTVELSWPLNDRFGNLSGLEILDAEGRVIENSWHERGMTTRRDRRHDRYSFPFDDQSQPSIVRLTTAEQNVNGQWLIPIPSPER